MDGARRHGREGHARDHGGHACRHDHRGVQPDRSRDWLATARIRASSGPTPSSSTSRCSSCWRYLRANDFKTFIVSGGGVEFMRPWTEQIYGIPPEQVVGSSGVTKFELRRRQAGADQGAQGRVHRRRAGQARRHQPLHRAPADLRLRQFRRRPADAGMDRGRRRARASWAWCTTPTPCANTPMTATRRSASSTRRCDEAMRRKAGPSST